MTDPFKRRTYDDFGEAGLKAGLAGDQPPQQKRPQHQQRAQNADFVDPFTLFEQMAAGYRSNDGKGFDDPMGGFEAFWKVFGGLQPEQQQNGSRQQQGAVPSSFSHSTSQPTPAQKSPTTARVLEKPELLERPFACTLEELYHGCTRTIKYIRHVTEGRITKEQECSLQVEVKPGWNAGTKLTFRGEGHIVPGFPNGDVCFILQEVPHPHYKREGKDLIYTANITLAQAFSGIRIKIPLLGSPDKKESPRKGKHKHDKKEKDKRSRHKGKNKESEEEEGEPEVAVIKIREIIHPKYEYRIVGAGMPKSKKPGEFGDMLVRFDIQFPEHMTTENRKKVKELVEQSM